MAAHLEKLHPEPIPAILLDDIAPELESVRDSIDGTLSLDLWFIGERLYVADDHSGTGPAQKRYQLEQSFGQTLRAGFISYAPAFLRWIPFPVHPSPAPALVDRRDRRDSDR